MRLFASSGQRLWNLSREAKVVYTGFGLFSLLALAVSMLLYEDMAGSRGVRAYYAGEAVPAASSTTRAAPSATPAPGGPEIALPDEEVARPDQPAASIAVPVSYRKLLEVTHFHLFTAPVFLLIVAHLFMLTGLSSTAKLAWIISAWLAALLHLGAPWVVRYGSPALGTPLYLISGVAMAVTSTVLTVLPLWAMWSGPPRRDPGAA